MRVGLLVGRETSFPENFIKHVNSERKDIQAEMLKVGAFKADELCQYDVIIDRISHEIPFYRTFLKTATLSGTVIINNPFWWSADDKYFGTALLERLGIAIPRTVILPQRAYGPDTSSESLRNLQFPLDWLEIAGYTGLPAIMKPYDGGGWKNVYKIHSLEELLFYYNQSGTTCMMLQEFIQFDRYVRCYTIGRKEVRIMPYDPTKPYLHHQYFNDSDYLDADLKKRIIDNCKTLNEALGYDINTAEFAIRDGIPYAIDFTNPAPDAELESVGEENHKWFIEKVANLVAEYGKRKKAGANPAHEDMRWSKFLNPQLAAAR